MNCKKSNQRVFGLALVALLLAGCGVETAEPTATPTSVPLTATLTPFPPTETYTPIPPTATLSPTVTITPLPPTATTTRTPSLTPVPPQVTPTYSTKSELPPGWTSISSDALGFSVGYLEGAAVFEGDESVNILYQEGIVVVKRVHLMPGQTVQDVAENFVSSLEEPTRSSLLPVPSAMPLNIPECDANFWDLSPALLLMCLEGSDIGLVYAYLGEDTADWKVLLAADTLSSIRFLQP